MKRIIIVLVSLIFLIATASPAICKNQRNRNTQNRNYKERPDNRHQQNNRWNPKHRSHKYKNHYDNGRRHSYKGHYRSWDDWNRYSRRNPYMQKHGTYYYENNVHLMFKFCDPDTGGCFFFSIGR